METGKLVKPAQSKEMEVIESKTAEVCKVLEGLSYSDCDMILYKASGEIKNKSYLKLNETK